MLLIHALSPLSLRSILKLRERIPSSRQLSSLIPGPRVYTFFPLLKIDPTRRATSPFIPPSVKILLRPSFLQDTGDSRTMTNPLSRRVYTDRRAREHRRVMQIPVWTVITGGGRLCLRRARARSAAGTHGAWANARTARGSVYSAPAGAWENGRAGRGYLPMCAWASSFWGGGAGVLGFAVG